MKYLPIYLVIAVVAVVAIINRKALGALLSGTATPPAATPPAATVTNTATATTSTTKGAVSAPITGTAAALNSSLLLTTGSKGAEVKQLQAMLNNYSHGGAIAVDGVFGDATRQKLLTITYDLTGGTAYNQITLAQFTNLVALSFVF